MLGTVLDGVTKAGANTISSIEFTIRHMTRIEDEALRLAVPWAREKAEIIASAAGMRLGSPISIQQGEAYHPSPMRITLMESSAPIASAAPAISAGKQRISVSITADFSMMPLP
jgi:uncharacterized protein YggE